MTDITMSWDAVILRNDGTPIGADLDHYAVTFTAPSYGTNTVNIPAGTSSYTVTGLSPVTDRTLSFTVKAVDVYGQVSSASAEATIDFGAPAGPAAPQNPVAIEI